jgi:type IV pilus biogenesis protein CpaD/CtpE
MATTRSRLRCVRAASIAALMLAQTACVYNNPPLIAGQPCQPWVEYPADPHSNAESPYLGCTNRVNLENMVDQPKDLRQGRALGPANGAHEANGVHAYEEGQIKPFANPNAPPAISFTPGLTTGTTGSGP